MIALKENKLLIDKKQMIILFLSNLRACNCEMCKWTYNVSAKHFPLGNSVSQDFARNQMKFYSTLVAINVVDRVKFINKVGFLLGQMGTLYAVYMYCHV